MLGTFTAKVKFNAALKSLSILVVAGHGQSILGRDLVKVFGLTLVQVNSVRASMQKQQSLEQLLEKHAALFDGSLGGRYIAARKSLMEIL